MAEQIFGYRIKFKIGSQRIWREGVSMQELESAKQKALELRSELVKLYKAEPQKIQMAIFFDEKMIWLDTLAPTPAQIS